MILFESRSTTIWLVHRFEAVSSLMKSSLSTCHSAGQEITCACESRTLITVFMKSLD